MAINLSTTVLDGLSLTAPAIDGDGLFGTVAVWADGQSNGTVMMAYSGNSYAPEPVNSAWTTFDTPAVALAFDWETLFVAFTDYNGNVQLGSSVDGWQTTTTIAQGGIAAGPALAYSSDLLYIAWKTSNSQLAFATVDQSNNITYFESDVPLTSRPTICAEDPYRIYVLCGGGLNPPDPATLMIYLSLDGGKTFTVVPTQPNTCYGPPSLTLLDAFYLVYADGQTSQLRLARTTDLISYTPMDYAMGCHGGGPAVVPMVTFPDPNDVYSGVFSLSSGWTIGSGDSNNHRVAVGSFGPLPIDQTQIEKQQRRIAKLKAPRAPDPCPDPLTVYNPATGECVPKGGCWGICVINSYTSAWGAGPVFNPIAYGFCVAKCLNN